MVSERKPTIAVTLGDPAGIGPEVVVRACVEPSVHDWCRPVLIGRPEIIRRAVSLLELACEIDMVESPAAARPAPNRLSVICCGSPEAADVPIGHVDARGGQLAYDAVVAAARLALDRQVDALTTAPLHKEALHLAGYDYPGHTELLAELCGIKDFAMMLYLGPGAPLKSDDGLAVVHVTLHTAMQKVFAELNDEAVLSKIRLADHFMRRVKAAAPKIGVCALNPHGGEGGLFGDEERRIIVPAVKRARLEGFQADGPMPTDTLMVHARDGRYDAIVAMYHDQGHIALKLLGMHRAVNVTLGLSIIRTSVAHGTAMDIAWQGKAISTSMIEALRVAARLAQSV